MDYLLSALSYCIKFGFSVFALCVGVRYLANFAFKFLLEEIKTNE